MASTGKHICTPRARKKVASQDTQDAAAFHRGKPEKPTNLTPLAADKWDDLIKSLSRRRTLTKDDGHLLELCAEQYAGWRKDRTLLDAEGSMIDTVVLDSNGTAHDKTIVNPRAKLVASAENSYRATLRELGLGIVSREHAKPTAAPKVKEKLAPTAADGLIALSELSIPTEEEEPHGI